MKATFVAFVLAASLLTAAQALAAGFGIYTQGADALGQADAVVAHTDGPSAIFFNPALINSLKGTRIEVGTTFLQIPYSFQSDVTGNSSEVNNRYFFPSTFYATHSLTDRLSVGFGVFSPFGLASDWPEQWEGRYIATFSKLRTFNFNPVVSYRITPQITAAVGLDFLILDATLEKKLNVAMLGLPDINQKFEGDGHGFGCNAGLLIELHRDVSLGIAYRSGIRVNDISGSVSHEIPLPDVPPQVAALFPNTSASTSLRMPAQFFTGLTYKGFRDLVLEGGLRWEGFSSVKSIDIKLDNPVGGVSESVTPKNWRDVLSFMVGAKYRFNDTWAASVGYLYTGNAVPDDTFDPSVPDANANLYTAGVSYRKNNITVDLAYSYQQNQSRTKNNTIDDNIYDGVFNPATSANGRYTSHINMIALSLGYAF